MRIKKLLIKIFEKIFLKPTDDEMVLVVVLFPTLYIGVYKVLGKVKYSIS